MLLAEVAARTDRIRLGTGVLNVWGRSPAGLAMLARTLDEVSGGRFELGLGAGSPQLAEGLHDTPFRDPVGRLAAVTRQVRRLLAGERLLPARPGEHRPLRLGTEPTPGLPINLAALGPARDPGRRRAGRRLVPVPAADLRPARGHRAARRGARPRAGRSRPRIAPCLPVAVAPDPEQARRLASWWVAFYLTSMGPLYPRTLRRLGHGAAVDAVVAGQPDPAVPRRSRTARRAARRAHRLGRRRAPRRRRLDRWYAAGAELPVLALPPNRPLGRAGVHARGARAGDRAPTAAVGAVASGGS